VPALNLNFKLKLNFKVQLEVPSQFKFAHRDCQWQAATGSAAVPTRGLRLRVSLRPWAGATVTGTASAPGPVTASGTASASGSHGVSATGTSTYTVTVTASGSGTHWHCRDWQAATGPVTGTPVTALRVVTRSAVRRLGLLVGLRRRVRVGVTQY